MTEPKYIFFAQGDKVPDRTVMLMLRMVSVDNGAIALQCQGANELNAWDTILTIHSNGECNLSTDLPHGLTRDGYYSDE